MSAKLTPFNPIDSRIMYLDYLVWIYLVSFNSCRVELTVIRPVHLMLISFAVKFSYI